MRKIHLFEPVILEGEKEAYYKKLGLGKPFKYTKQAKDFTFKNMCDGTDDYCKWAKENIKIGH